MEDKLHHIYIYIYIYLNYGILEFKIHGDSELASDALIALDVRRGHVTRSRPKRVNVAQRNVVRPTSAPAAESNLPSQCSDVSRPRACLCVNVRICTCVNMLLCNGK